MVTFKQVAFKKDMIKVFANGQEVWYECDKAAKGFASKVFKDGDDVELVTEQRNGKTFVTQVRKPGGSAQAERTNASQPSSAPQPAAKPSSQPSTGGGKYGAKTPEESEKITRLSVMSSAANAVQVLTGQINDPAILGDIVVSLYNKMLAEIKK